MRVLKRIVVLLGLFLLVLTNVIFGQGELKISDKIKNIPEGKWIKIQESSMGARAFNKVHYALNINALVAWGTTMHGQKKYLYPVGHFDMQEGVWEEAVPTGMTKDISGRYGVGAWNPCGVSSFFDCNGFKIPRGAVTTKMSAWDSKQNRVIYFAGITFSYDPAKRSWTELKPKLSPVAGAQLASMCYDVAKNRMVMVGGLGLHTPEARPWTWFFDCAANEWSKPTFGPKLLIKFRSEIRDAGLQCKVLRRDAQYLMGLLGEEKSKAEDKLKVDIKTFSSVVAKLSGTVQTSDEEWLALDKKRLSATIEVVNLALQSLKSTESLSGLPLVVALESAEDNLLYRAIDAVSTQPPPRCHASLVYDKKNEMVVLFGGDNLEAKLNDTWVLDAKINRWLKIETPMSPPAQASMSMCYMPKSEVIFLASLLGNWTFDLSKKEWKPVAGKLVYIGGRRSISINAIPETDIVIAVVDHTYGSRLTFVYKLPSSESEVPIKNIVTKCINNRPQPKTHKYSRKWYDDLPAPKPDVFATKIKSLTENIWTPIKAEKEALARTWGSCTYDSNRREIIYWGGGHSGNVNCNVDHFSMLTGRWSRNRDSSLKPEPFGSKTIIPNGRTYNNEPWLMHARKTYAYDSISGKVIMTQVGYRTSVYVHYTWVYDPRTGEWDSFISKEQVSAGYYGQVVGTPHGLMLLVAGQLWKLDVNNKKWSKLGEKQNKKQMIDYEQDSIVYDSKRDRLIFMGKVMQYFDFKTNIWTKAGDLSQMSREAVYVPSQDAVFALDKIVKGVAHFKILLCAENKIIDGPISPFKGSSTTSEQAMTIDPETETILWIDAHGFCGSFTIKALKLNVAMLIDGGK